MLGYRSASWLLRTLPAGPTGAVLGLASQGSYLVWPKKRDWSNQNFGHVLGLPPDDPRVRRLALRAYREYGRYLVELMRVPYLPEEEVVGARRSRSMPTRSGASSTRPTSAASS